MKISSFLRPARFIAGGALFLISMLAEHGLLYIHIPPVWPAVLSYLLLGFDVFRECAENITGGNFFTEDFLMTVASLGGMIIGERSEAVAVLVLFQLGEFIEDRAAGRSRDSINAILDLRPDRAWLRKDGKYESVSPETVAPGDTILVKPGEKIPLDGEVISGNTYINMSALTGEAEPAHAGPGDAVLSGTVNMTSPVSVLVTKRFGDSAAVRIADMIENGLSNKARTERFISRFSKIYTPAVIAVSALVAVLPSVITGDWQLWVYRGLCALVLSCPCALLVSLPLTYYSAAGACARAGLLVKGSVYLEALADADTVVFDKTGTVTKGSFRVTSVIPSGGLTEKEVLYYAAHAEYYSPHPLSDAIVSAYLESGTLSEEIISGYSDVPGKGLRALIDGKEVLCGKKALLEKHGVSCPGAPSSGAVFVAVGRVFSGIIITDDEIREEASGVIGELVRKGYSTVMLTGDCAEKARNVSGKLEIGTYRHSLMPGDKVKEIRALSASGRKTVFVGDGINDAPVIAEASVGIAMGGLGSDAALEAADAVLMNDDLRGVTSGLRIAKRSVLIAKENIAVTVAVKTALVILGCTGMISMWMSVFGDVGVLLIVVANALRALKKA